MNRSFELIIEVFSWIKIVLSPFIIGSLIGLIIYLILPDHVGLTIGIICSAVGLTFGIVWANRIWKKEGTHHFLSKIMATPDLDKQSTEKVNEEKIKK